MDISSIFGAARHVGPAQECARAVVIFVYGYVAVRLVGRRVFGKWAALDIVVSVIIGSNLSRALTGSAHLLGTMAATTVVLALHWALAQLACRQPRLSRLIEGRPFDLAQDGELRAAMLHRWSISQADIDEALRARGVARLEPADRLVLEPSGGISLLRGAALSRSGEGG
ncbi:MAG TPA: YetF domain-containing protein [Caulobacteraceae bacterium]|jgi:uncharacterized membrane protein YcaP (DUF421 family)|nr:YetF domain-containing protein [Caulobacteraceae bacterium]